MKHLMQCFIYQPFLKETVIPIKAYIILKKRDATYQFQKVNLQMTRLLGLILKQWQALSKKKATAKLMQKM
ncbi:Uncharacterised protein [Mycobacteroides abscessus subsp. abscessus]|nr:Uncharacterised protein [Mycobacteroides abscessus subsp. abscessus]